MILIVSPHKIVIRKTPVNEREYDVSRVYFEFSDEITDDFTKEAYFTLNGNTYRQIIVNDECSIPSEVLVEKGQVEIGVVATKIEGGNYEKRYNPSPVYIATLQGSLRGPVQNHQEITPSEFEQYMQALNDGLAQITDIDIDVNKVDRTTTNDDPATLFGGTWTLVGTDRVLWGVSSSTNAGSTLDEQLPDIRGHIDWKDGGQAKTEISSGSGTFNGVDTSDANAIPSDIQEGKTAYVNGVKITGTRNVGDIFESLGYTETPVSITGYDYAKEIMENWDSTITDMEILYQGDEDLFIYPKVDTSNVTTMSATFEGCRYLGSLPALNTSNVTNMSATFSDCVSLYAMPLIDTSNVTTMDSMFYSCGQLTTVPQFNTNNLRSASDMFTNCFNLSNDSLNNILAMCANASNYTSPKTLRGIGLSSTQASTCQSLSNYQTFLDAGWTTGY